MDTTLVAGIIVALGALLAPAVPLFLRFRRRRKKSRLEIPTAKPIPAAPTPPPATAGTVWTYLSREAAYTAVPQVIQQVNQEQNGTKHLLLAALHGHSGDRLVSRGRPIPEFSSFDASLFQCVRSAGPGMWIVRELYNITAEDRLDEIFEWVMRTKDEDGYEVRAFCMPDAISHLAPLIIGARDVFLGLEDPRYYRIQGAIHVQDEGAVQLVTRYFELLWNDPRAVVLRSAVRVEESGIERIRRMIRGRKA